MQKYGKNVGIQKKIRKCREKYENTGNVCITEIRKFCNIEIGYGNTENVKNIRIMEIRSFITLTPGVSVIKTFTSLSTLYICKQELVINKKLNSFITLTTGAVCIQSSC